MDTDKKSERNGFSPTKWGTSSCSDECPPADFNPRPLVVELPFHLHSFGSVMGWRLLAIAFDYLKLLENKFHAGDGDQKPASFRW
jgi:hypothetical protein